MSQQQTHRFGLSTGVAQGVVRELRLNVERPCCFGQFVTVNFGAAAELAADPALDVDAAVVEEVGHNRHRSVRTASDMLALGHPAVIHPRMPTLVA